MKVAEEGCSMQRYHDETRAYAAHSHTGSILRLLAFESEFREQDEGGWHI